MRSPYIIYVLFSKYLSKKKKEYYPSKKKKGIKNPSKDDIKIKERPPDSYQLRIFIQV